MIKRKSMSLFFMIITAALLLACDADVSEPSKEPAVRPAKLIKVENAINKQTNRYPAMIGAAKSSDLTFQVSGLLQEIAVNETQQVKQGDVIAKLDQRDYKNNVDSAKAQFDNTEAEYQRAVRLLKQDAIAKSVLEQRKSQRDVAKAQLDTANKALNDTVLRAPFAGVITNVPVKKLQNIQAGETIASIISAKAMEATIDLPASVIATAKTRTDLGTFVILDAAPQKRIPAKFKEAILEADTVSQTYAVKFTFTPPEELVILPGMNATVLLVTSMKEAKQSSNVSVPLAAVMSDGSQQYLWVVNNDDMTVTKRSITIEEGIGETVVVTQGLAAGETIIGAGAAYLAEGMKVRPWTE